MISRLPNLRASARCQFALFSRCSQRKLFLDSHCSAHCSQ
jgi:hypothetical protein